MRKLQISKALIGCTFIIILFNAIASSALRRKQSEESKVLDKNIPEDWREYLPDVPTITNDLSTVLFQDDIAGVNSEELSNLPENMTAKLWSNNLVPFEFSPFISYVARQRTLEALANISNNTCIRLIPRKYEEDYLVINSGLKCFSYVGRQKGPQVIVMGRNCMQTLGGMQHEFLHALGIIHEQSRMDRNDYVWINKNNINRDDETLAQFFRYGTNGLNVPYDYNSIMHLTWDAYAKNKNYPTILPKQKHTDIGQRDHLSPLDIQRINSLYNCMTPNPPSIPIDYSAPTFSNWSLLCDGKQDTPTGWDEHSDNCLQICDLLDQQLFGGKVLFNVPTTKQCLSKKSLCDGRKDGLTDISENPEMCLLFCKDGGFVALSPSYQCIHFSQLCDGAQDTRDASDEIKTNCQNYCQSPSSGFSGQLFNFQPTGQCMMKVWLCDGKSSATLQSADTCRLYCQGNGFFTVPTTQHCLQWKKLCDGYDDVSDGWDELPDNCRQQCTNIDGLQGDLISMSGTGQCMHKRWLCNGLQYSQDDTSENPEVCQNFCTGNLYFPADDTQQCIRTTDLCDGKQDTRNGWDELKANCVKYCKFMNTKQNLVINPKSKRCVEIVERTLDPTDPDVE